MGQRMIIYGPPGTGKTTTLLRILEKELKRNKNPRSIAFSSFTRAARREASTRAAFTLNIDPDELEWFRTIHSTAYNLLEVERDQMMSREHWKEFREQTGWDITPDDSCKIEAINVHTRHTEDDRLRYVYDYGRSRGLGIVQSMSQSPVAVNFRKFRKFVEDFEEFKHDLDLLDFTDLLQRALKVDRRPPVEVAFIDEAQDLSPLQIQCVEHWFRACERIYIAGDDDQAIYSFQGADPTWLIQQYSEHPHQILAQSYRIPKLVHAIAQRIIQQNMDRIPKDYAPKDEEGEVVDVESLDDWDENVLVLCRNRMFFKLVAQRLEESGVAFDVDGQGYLPHYSKDRHVSAIRAIMSLHRFGSIPRKDWRRVLSLIPASSGYLPRGLKAKYEKTGAERVSKSELMLAGCSRFLSTTANEPIAPLQKLSKSERSYWANVLARYGNLPAPSVTISTIHGSKGSESDNVLIVPDLSKACFENTKLRNAREGENRVAYVAVTRAKKKIGFLKTSNRKRFQYPRG